MRRWAELVGALTLLTRLPVGGLAAAHPPPATCVWAYPLVGIVIGLCGAAVMLAASGLGAAPPVAVILAIATTVLVTGALHEDGLADTADGLGGGRTTEQKLAIMRDSRIGTYGALALLLSIALRVAALTAAAHPALALIVAEASGRAGLLVPILLLRPARPDGLGGTLAARALAAVWAGFAITAALGATAPWATLAAIAASAGMAALVRRQLGGYTGDTLGATEQAAHCAALLALMS